MLETAFHTHQDADVVGAYCQLRGPPFLPTIDTGTGTWESHLPGKGAIPVIRTGSACILIKRKVYEAMEPPWYGIRPAPRPIDMLAEVDNYARIKFDGRNPFFEKDEWQALVKCAREDAVNKRRDNLVNYNNVGEDSNFADRAKALGFNIIVQTNAVVHHVDTKLITPQDHAEAMRRTRDDEDRAGGILR